MPVVGDLEGAVGTGHDPQLGGVGAAGCGWRGGSEHRRRDQRALSGALAGLGGVGGEGVQSCRDVEESCRDGQDLGARGGFGSDRRSAGVRRALGKRGVPHPGGGRVDEVLAVGEPRWRPSAEIEREEVQRVPVVGDLQAAVRAAQRAQAGLRDPGAGYRVAAGEQRRPDATARAQAGRLARGVEAQRVQAPPARCRGRGQHDAVGRHLGPHGWDADGRTPGRRVEEEDSVERGHILAVYLAPRRVQDEPVQGMAEVGDLLNAVTGHGA